MHVLILTLLFTQRDLKWILHGLIVQSVDFNNLSYAEASFTVRIHCVSRKFNSVKVRAFGLVSYTVPVTDHEVRVCKFRTCLVLATLLGM